MTDSEFDVINRYFKSDFSRKDVSIGIGDDCALIDVSHGKQLVTTTDTLISGIHFPQQTSPEDIAYKAIAVNLSDLAAMGAEPAWLTLSITLPEINHHWLERFSESFHRSIGEHDVQLVGGDTTKGALSITIQAMGFVESGKSMLRANAKPGDKIYVSGYLGDAALGLALLEKKLPSSDDDEHFINRLNRPTARVTLGHAMMSVCSCAIDISDGLFADLGHILESSHCGAEVDLNKIPLSKQMNAYLNEKNTTVQVHELMTGDDYELCFVVSESNSKHIKKISEELNIPLTCIGFINQSDGLTCIDEQGIVEIPALGFNHFK